MRYVAHHAALARPAKDGRPQRAHLEFAAKRGSQSARARLDGPRYPRRLEYVHAWFDELNGTRSPSMSGIAPITYEQIDAWARLTHEQPRPHEVAALLELDRAFCHAYLSDSNNSTTTAERAT